MSRAGRSHSNAIYTHDGALDWEDDAACLGNDLSFFYSVGNPNKRGGADTELSLPGKHICEICDVRIECLEYAIRNKEPYGIWGGMTTRERKKFERERTRRSESECAT